jgi:hypothetical protein
MKRGPLLSKEWSRR